MRAGIARRMGFLLSKLLPQLLYPLGLGLLLQLAGSAGLARASRQARRWGLGLSGAGIGLVWLFAMPVISRQLIWGLEEQATALTPATIPQADAVVVLGGGLLAQAIRQSRSQDTQSGR